MIDLYILTAVVVHQYERLSQLTPSDIMNLRTPWGGYSGAAKLELHMAAIQFL